jgi:hypothetical protein
LCCRCRRCWCCSCCCCSLLLLLVPVIFHCPTPSSVGADETLLTLPVLNVDMLENVVKLFTEHLLPLITQGEQGELTETRRSVLFLRLSCHALRDIAAKALGGNLWRLSMGSNAGRFIKSSFLNPEVLTLHLRIPWNVYLAASVDSRIVWHCSGGLSFKNEEERTTHLRDRTGALVKEKCLKAWLTEELSCGELSRLEESFPELGLNEVCVKVISTEELVWAAGHTSVVSINCQGALLEFSFLFHEGRPP